LASKKLISTQVVVRNVSSQQYYLLELHSDIPRIASDYMQGDIISISTTKLVLNKTIVFVFCFLFFAPVEPLIYFNFRF